MRKVFIQSLTKLANSDERILFLTSDLGYMVIEEFIERFPDRFFNIGAAEQNMLGLATGLAEAGFIPFVYSIAPFAALRPFEFIRNGPVYHHLPVRIVGVGQGVEYGFNGHTHFGLEDVGVLRTQPGLTIIAPADNLQTQSALEQTYSMPGPIYFRLSKDSFEIPELGGAFALGEAQLIGNGQDALLISSGAITRDAIKAAEILAGRGIGVSILIISSITPPPVQKLVEELARFQYAFTIESHYVTGGVGSLVAEIIAEHRLGTWLTRLGFDSVFNDTIGSGPFIQEMYGLSSGKISEKILQILKDHD